MGGQSSKKAKILFVLEYYPPHMGGVEYLFENLTQMLARRGHEITVLTRRLKGTKKDEVINGVHIIRIKTFNRYLYTFLAFFKAVIIAGKFDIIHTTTFNAAFPARLAAKFRKKPCVITVHEVWVNKWHSLTEFGPVSASIHNFLEKMIYLLSFDKYITVSHSSLTQLEANGIPVEKITMIYNGFDINSYDPEKFDGLKIRKQYEVENAFVIFSWGRPGVSKGHEYLLRAVPIILEKIPHAKLLLMLSNKGTYEKRYLLLTELINKLDISENVILIEPVPYGELWYRIKLADCVVVPSLTEGFGYTVVEACVMDTPVVASDTASIPEVISNKYVLVEPGNPGAIAEGVLKVSQKEYQTSPLKKFPWEENITKHEELYRTLA
ncbi:MAG TPA: glycosyltransferase family 1 protein [bacterium]|nr:glycosyltransferase family 1 protein [bacterium]